MQPVHGGAARSSWAEANGAVTSLVVILCLCLFSGVVAAGWAECVQARLDGANAVRLLVTADEKGTVEFTIGENVIRFAVTANVELDTGRLRLDDANSVVAELSDAKGVVTARCELPVKELTAKYKTFCCDLEPPVIEFRVAPKDGGQEITWKVADTGSGVKTCRVVLVTGEQERELSIEHAGEKILTAAEFGEGNHQVRVWAVDEEGNEADAAQLATLAKEMCSICGQVLDASTKQPIEGVTVTLNNTNETRTTDAQGRFCFQGLEMRKHYLSFEKGNAYEFRSEGVWCREGGERSVTVSLVPTEKLEPEEAEAEEPGLEPVVLFSWTLDPADVATEVAMGENDTVHLYVLAPEGSMCSVCYDSTENVLELDPGFYAGIQLGLSYYAKTLPPECWVDGTRKLLIPADEILARCGSENVRLQVVAQMSNGAIILSDLLPVYIIPAS